MYDAFTEGTPCCHVEASQSLTSTWRRGSDSFPAASGAEILITEMKSEFSVGQLPMNHLTPTELQSTLYAMQRTNK